MITICDGDGARVGDSDLYSGEARWRALLVFGDVPDGRNQTSGPAL